MIRPLAFFALGVAIWAGAYAVPGHTGAWGILRGLMIATGSMTAGFQTGRMWDELRDRAGMRWRWWRNRRNARLGRGWSRGDRIVIDDPWLSGDHPPASPEQIERIAAFERHAKRVVGESIAKAERNRQ